MQASIAEPRPAKEGGIPADTGGRSSTAVPADRLRALNDQLLQLPDGFEGNEKLLKQLERRRERMNEGGIDWGQAEALAFASLLVEESRFASPARTRRRGTFSHRHAVLHDQRTGRVRTDPGASRRNASFEIYIAALGVRLPRLRVRLCRRRSRRPRSLWEAQYGDFVNGAQIVIDQFLVAGLSNGARPHA